MTVIAGNGEKDFKDGSSSEASFCDSMGLALDHEGRVVVADCLNHRVRALTLPSTRRLQRELSSFTSRHVQKVLPGCNVTRSRRSLFKWFALLQVAEGPFRGGLFELSVEMAFDYPASVPLVKFVTPITHPNVDPRTGEVSVPWNPARTFIGFALKYVQGLMEFPNVDERQQQVRNQGAERTWLNDRLAFDDRAYEEVRQSWLNKLKPSDTSELLCGMLCPARKLCRESQNKHFEAVAFKEMHAKQSQIVHTSLDPRAQEVQRLARIRADQDLQTSLTKTLIGLMDLPNRRLVRAQWLETELARLRVEETKQRQGGQALARASVPPTPERRQPTPETSKECFAMLVAEADREVTRLRDRMELCTSKYELLSSRFAKVLQIEDYVAPTNPNQEPAQTRQLLEASAGVLIAQAKLLESGLRAEFERLVQAVNEGEEKSPLRLSNGLLAQAKFGPGKSLSRVQFKCDENPVPVPPHSVLDYCRLTVVFADPLLLAHFHDELKQPAQDLPPHQLSRLRVVRVMNKFKLPRPWKHPNVHINFEFEGHVCEVQLILEDFSLIADCSHKPYELVRLVPRDPTTNKLNVNLMTRDKLDKAIEFVIAEGVYCKHPGPASFPSSASFFSLI